MSKPESAGTKSLEEILASIRQSLVEETPDRPAEPKVAAAKPVQPASKPVFPAAPAEDAGVLSGKLAGALNRPTANGPALDDDLAELLAPEAKKPAVPASAPETKLTDAGSEAKDPLWFLTAKPAAPESKSNGAQASPAHARAGDDTRAPVAEEVKLSRPEVLRASLPPLFGVNAGGAPAARTGADGGKAADVPALMPKAPSPPPAAETREAKAEPDAPAPTPEKSEAASVSLAALDLTEASSDRTVAPPMPFVADPIPAEAAPPASLGEPAAVQIAEVDIATAPDAEIEPAAAPHLDGKSAPPPLADAKSRAAPAAAAAARTMPPGVPPPGALERTIAELLEPVIRNWLDTNLPRMVEKVVREEVARAIAAERAAPKV